MDNPDKLATLDMQDTDRRQKIQPIKLKKMGSTHTTKNRG